MEKGTIERKTEMKMILITLMHIVEMKMKRAHLIVTIVRERSITIHIGMIITIGISLIGRNLIVGLHNRNMKNHLV